MPRSDELIVLSCEVDNVKSFLMCVLFLYFSSLWHHYVRSDATVAATNHSLVRASDRRDARHSRAGPQRRIRLTLQHINGVWGLEYVRDQCSRMRRSCSTEVRTPSQFFVTLRLHGLGNLAYALVITKGRCRKPTTSDGNAIAVFPVTVIKNIEYLAPGTFSSLTRESLLSFICPCIGTLELVIANIETTLTIITELELIYIRAYWKLCLRCGGIIPGGLLT